MFKKSLENIHLVKEDIPTDKKKCFLMVLLYLGMISLQTKTKLQQTFKGTLNWCKQESTFKCQTRLSNFFWFKDPKPIYFLSGVLYKFQSGFCSELYYDDQDYYEYY